MSLNVGFIGLGGMGKAMAANLVKAGHRVRVWNRSRPAAEALAAAGAIVVETPADAAGGDALITMLADDAATRQIVLDTGVLDALAQPATSASRADAAESAGSGTRAVAGTGVKTVFINMATVSVALARELTGLFAEVDVPYIAAPVFGRTEVAEAAKLNIVAAGDEAALDRVQPLFDVMGQKTWRVGDEPARANVVKIGGNFMIACAIETMAEAAVLARSHGLEASEFLDIMTSTLFASPVFKTYGGLIANEQYEPAAFRLVLGLKDVRLALAAGEAAHAPLPFGSVLRDSLLDAIAQGDAEKDWVALAKVAQRRAGL